MIKTKYKILIITITFILIMFFPKVANAKYLNVSTPSSGQPGSTVSVTVSTDCTGRFNVSVLLQYELLFHTLYALQNHTLDTLHPTASLFYPL